MDCTASWILHGNLVEREERERAACYYPTPFAIHLVVLVRLDHYTSLYTRKKDD